VRTVATIGVYRFDHASYIAALRGTGVDLVVDVRQRRGVRGREYAWANSVRLQSSLARAAIAYRHVRELAPTTELRQLQYREDARTGVGKRSRTVLAAEYRERYEREILDHADLVDIFGGLLRTLPALMCVERDPLACHRSLIAARLQQTLGWRVQHIVPGPVEHSLSRRPGAP
jgi:uncharacterized protein (DUF488 family)